MEWLKRINAAIDLMEQRMDEPLDNEAIAKAAYSSPFHFQRMFFMLTGMTVAEYVRKRKLTLAAHELATTSARVLDVALKYGYDSPESFAKAFKKVHGISPSKVRQSGVMLKAFPRITLQFSLTGNLEVDYQIVEKESFTVVGKSVQIRCEQDLRLQFWRECHFDGTINRLKTISADQNLLGITMDFSETFTYMIAAKNKRNVEAESLSPITIPASTWAIFTSVGPLPSAIQHIFAKIYQEWFPATGYEHSGAPEIEVYPPGDTSSDDYRCEVWIPVLKR